MERIYLDNAATTPTDPKVTEAMAPYFFEKFGNPSSIHSFGREARKGTEEARSKVAAFLGAKEEEIVFTLEQAVVQCEDVGNFFETTNAH